MWAIELKDSGKFIGRVGLHRPEGWPDLELGWMLTAEQRGHGYATEGRARRARLRVQGSASRSASSASSASTTRRPSASRDASAGRQATTIDFLGGSTLVYVYHPPGWDS